MKYVVSHTTEYRYSSPVSVCHNLLMLEPRHSEFLQCSRYSLRITPEPKHITRRLDMFGNVLHRFSLEENHANLSITSRSTVTVQARSAPMNHSSPTCSEIAASRRARTDSDWLQIAPFFHDSPRITRAADYQNFAADCLLPDKPILSAAKDLTAKIYSEFDYDTDATLVDTPTESAFAGRHGVCQDFAHVAVSCLRSSHLPARYVSGYLRTKPPEGKERLVGADESHAWFSVYCGNEIGWMDFDPTNNCIAGTDHVTIAVGRDYSDVVPVKGIFLGGGDPAMSIRVDVAPVT